MEPVEVFGRQLIQPDRPVAGHQVPVRHVGLVFVEVAVPAVNDRQRVLPVAGRILVPSGRRGASEQPALIRVALRPGD